MSPRREDHGSHTEADAAWWAAQLGRDEYIDNAPHPYEYQEDES